MTPEIFSPYIKITDHPFFSNITQTKNPIFLKKVFFVYKPKSYKKKIKDQLFDLLNNDENYKTIILALKNVLHFKQNANNIYFLSNLNSFIQDFSNQNISDSSVDFLIENHLFISKIYKEYSKRTKIQSYLASLNNSDTIQNKEEKQKNNNIILDLQNKIKNLL